MQSPDNLGNTKWLNIIEYIWMAKSIKEKMNKDSFRWVKNQVI